MDKGDLTSGSDMRKKLKLDDDDSVNDSEDDVEDDIEKEDFEEMSDDDAEKEKDGGNAMAKLFIASGFNPNIIKKGPFANFMGLVAPNITLLENEVLEIHEEYKEKAKKFLKDFQGNLTLFYEWMLLGNSLYDIGGLILHDNFVCITAHFIDDNWKVRNWILGYTTDQSIPLDDIYPYHFRSIVQGFEIENKVSTILLPNHEEFDEKMVAAIRKCVQEKGNYSINPPVFQIYCCADLFRLMFEDVYSELSGKLLEDLRMLVGWGRCSAPYWNVWLFNLQEAVDLQSEDAFSKDEIYDDYDNEDWIKIETFCKLIGCIYKVAKELFEQGLFDI